MWQAAIPAIAGAFGKAMEEPAPAGPSRADAQSATYGNGIDGSGWNVNFSGSQSAGSNKAGQSLAESMGLAAPGGGISPLLVAGAVAIVAVVAWARSRRK